MNGHQTRPGDRAAAVAIDPDGIDTIATDRRTQTADLTEPGRSRRGLLAAAGGIALATSGLLVPEWLVEEAAAGEKPGRRVQDHTNPRRR